MEPGEEKVNTMRVGLARAGMPLIGTLALVLLVSAPSAAQQGASLTGTVTRAGANDPLVPPGEYHVSVRAEGYSTRRTEVTVTPEGATLDLVVALDLHFAEVISVSPTARSQFESYQPTSVLAGQELTKQLEGTIGATLQGEPGIAMRSIGPGPARPVIRGLDGDRIVVLEDGQRVGDLSSQSADHGVTVNPASAQRIEVVRGPASLLYGANAIGGLVNVITDQIPTEPVSGTPATSRSTSAATRRGAGAGDIHVGNGQFALHVGGGGRRAGEYSTPEGEVDNSQRAARSAASAGRGPASASYIGGSVAIRRHEVRHPGSRTITTTTTTMTIMTITTTTSGTATSR
jgi:iron complex outermembrane recepter protein